MPNLFRSFLRAVAILTVVAGVAFSTHADDSGRKVKVKISPQYPELAKRMNVAGAVKLELIIAANGEVKSIRPLGGHPLLIDAAQSAVKQWKYEAGPEATEVVEIRFEHSKDR